MAEKPNISRVLIANRGEIALRAAQTCRALGLQTVGVFSTADAVSPHVWAADQALCIGPPAANQSYLAIPALLHVAKQTGCDAIYPGYGFLAENAEFARQCGAHGIKFIGPSPETIEIMGDKSKAREIALDHGVPVVPGSKESFVDAAAALAAGDGIGYPILLKARSGGGGRGMREVKEASDFPGAFAQAAREAEAAFSDGAIYMERFFPTVRHIEVQVLGDGKGGAVVFDERDCSVQRRHQKLIEESPSPAVGAGLRKRLLGDAEKLTRGIRYEGAGTIEFILDTANDEYFFIEMNTRIQVEHPVTEMRSGFDLVRTQFELAMGAPLPDAPSNGGQTGHALEFRINAEDWQRGFQPVPGEISTWRPPSGPGIRLDSAAYPGMRVSPYYDSMIAKLIVHGSDRADALNKARGALDAFDCQGIASTIGFHRMIVDHPAFKENHIHTRWIETEWNVETAGATP